MSFYPKTAGKYSAKTKRRAKYLILVSALIMIIFMGSLTMRGAHVNPSPGKISVTLNAQVIRDGVLINEVTKDDDLLLENFVNLMESVLRWPNVAVDDRVTLWDPNGNDFQYLMWGATSEGMAYDTDSCDPDCIAYYGSGVTAPDREDRKIEASEEGEKITSSSQDADSFTLTFIRVNTAGPYDWSETSLTIEFWSDDEANPYTNTFVRDTFTPMGVIVDDVMVINYKFNFATGYTTNAITFIKTLMSGSEASETETCILTDVSGTSRTVTIYDDADGADFFGYSGSALYGGYMLVSDNTYGIPSRTANLLYGSSLQTTVTAVVDDSNWDVILSSVYIPTSEISIVASAYYRYTAHSGGGAYFMMFALTHSSVYVASGTPVKATFTVGL